MAVAHNAPALLSQDLHSVVLCQFFLHSPCMLPLKLPAAAGSAVLLLHGPPDAHYTMQQRCTCFPPWHLVTTQFKKVSAYRQPHATAAAFFTYRSVLKCNNASLWSNLAVHRLHSTGKAQPGLLTCHSSSTQAQKAHVRPAGTKILV
jgi:hypothetical protein